MPKLYRKYSTRDLLTLEKRGDGRASVELMKRALVTVSRNIGRDMGNPFVDQARFFAQIDRREKQIARFNPLSATGPVSSQRTRRLTANL